MHFVFLGVRGGGGFLRFCRALVSSRISLMAVRPSAEAFVQMIFGPPPLGGFELLAIGGTPVVLSRNAVLIVVAIYPHWSTLQVLL